MLLHVPAFVAVVLCWAAASDETIRFDPCGADGICVTVMPSTLPVLVPPNYPSGFIGHTPSRDTHSSTTLTQGNLRAIVGDDGRLAFQRVSDGTELLSERVKRSFTPIGSQLSSQQPYKYFSVDLAFKAYADERIYGLGQHKTGVLDNKGQTFRLQPVNTEILIPVLHSTRDYSFVWNLPSTGSVTLAENETHWHADAAPYLSFWVCTTAAPKITANLVGTLPPPAVSPWADRMAKFTALVGRAPVFPSWVSGYWQSKNRYRTQAEVLEVVRGYRKLKLPLAVVVVDYHTWDDLPNATVQHTPNIPVMMKELSTEPPVELMISPYYNFIGRNTSRYRDAAAKNILGLDEDGTPTQGIGVGSALPTAMWDVYSAEGRSTMMQGVVEGYTKPYGIKHFWLDCDEPCQSNPVATWAGMPAPAVGAAYPDMLARATRNAMNTRNNNGSVMLGRSAWLGSQKHGTAVWSGDTNSSWPALQQQVRAGLNMALSGIVYWTTDIGGYAGGGGGPQHMGFNHNIYSPEYLQLLTRWFQFGAMCPLFRSHGHRLPTLPSITCDGSDSGGYNEIWHFAEPFRSAITRTMHLREQLRPYIESLYRAAADSGAPVIRMLLYEFSNDAQAAHVSDQFMLGSTYLAAPVLQPNVTHRSVYFPVLPKGEAWRPFFFPHVEAAAATAEAAAVVAAAADGNGALRSSSSRDARRHASARGRGRDRGRDLAHGETEGLQAGQPVGSPLLIPGGRTIAVATPLDSFPLYERVQTTSEGRTV